MYRLNHLARVAVLGAIVAVAACENKATLLGPTTPAGGPIFSSYVALGNSITAGYQSGGINDSTQRQSYARLLANQMGSQYHYPSLAMPGCPPPIANGLTGARLPSPVPCATRSSSSVTDVLNNVAVPGARVLDPISASTVASNALTQFILGGKTQVARALDAKPTFATIWIGNNDVLEAGYTGLLVPTAAPVSSAGIVSTQAQFQASYDVMIKQLLDSAPGLKGVLIGVVQVSGIAGLTPASLIASSPVIQATLTAAAGKPVTVHPNCTGSTALVEVQQLLGFIKAGGPPVIACDKNTPGFPFPIGDLFILDPTEQATLTATINGYNTYIASKAATIGFAYYDPNPLLAAQKASGAIPAFPNFQSSTATFGALFSLDGIHPAAAGHVLIANGIIGAINAKYGTTLALVP